MVANGSKWKFERKIFWLKNEGLLILTLPYCAFLAKRWVEENTGNEKFSAKKAFFMVFWRRGFLDGKAGFTYATLQSIYEYFIVVKTREMINKNKETQA